MPVPVPDASSLGSLLGSPCPACCMYEQPKKAHAAQNKTRDDQYQLLVGVRARNLVQA